MSHALRLRRVLSLSTAILAPTRRTTVSVALTAAATTLNHTPAAVNSAVRHFHSTQHLSFSSYAPRSFNDVDKIDADTILFEGCDYKHFLIVMDFGKDPNQRPPPDQMIETYVQTCAKVLGSVEEAKRKIYACSTTTYTGFQVEVDEETSKKFEGLPGVTFVLPDSYIDPVNKEYGGDKYNYGEIIPRAPPAQYSRRTSDRRNDQRPRDSMRNQQGNSSYNQPGNRAYNQQGNASYNQLGSMPQGGTGYPQQGSPQRQSFPSQQNYPPQQNYIPSGQADRGTPMPGGAHYPGVGTDGGQRNFVPSQEGNYNHPQGQMSNQPGNPGSYAPPDPVNYAHNHPEGQRGNHPVGIGGYAPPVPGAYGQTSPATGAYGQTAPATGPYGQTAPATGPYGQTAPVAGPNGQTAPVAGAYGQPGVGTFEQNRGVQYSQPPSGNNYGHGAGHIPHAENQSFPPGLNEQGRPLEHGVNPYGAQPGFNQGRY